MGVSGSGRAWSAGLPGSSTEVSGRALCGRGGQCSGRCWWRVGLTGVVEQRVEGVFPGPVAGQVQHQASGRPGDACGHRDQLVADGGGGGFGVEGRGERTGSAGEVERMAAQTSHALFVANWLEGRCASAEPFRSAMTPSTMACERWSLSASRVLIGESVNTA